MTFRIKRLRHAVGRLAARMGVARIQLRHNEDGSTTVEFALVAIPFIAIMLAIIETAMTFFAQQAMETAVQNAGRLIRTGQAQEQGLNATTFKAKICNQIQIMFACTSQLAIDVRGYSTFDSISYTPPINEDGELDIDDFVYEPGSGGEIIVLRAYYEWPVLINVFGMNDYSNLSNGKHLITSTAAFKNEPFPW